MQPIVSVIIPTHNRAHLIKKAVFSVLSQTFQAFEIIIINDASKDETAKVLLFLSQLDERIRILTHERALGGGCARNKGIEASRGKWIAFLDDDDSWHPKKIQKQLEILEANPRAVAANCFYTIHYPLNIKKTIATPAEISFDHLLRANVLGGTSVCIALASALKEIKGFDPRLRSAQDWDLWVKLRKLGEIVTVKESLVDYFVHFNYRISNDMSAKYMGARRFYFKYQSLMNTSSKQHQLRFICFIRSRQSERPFKKRIANLMLALKQSGLRNKLGFTLSSLPRILLDKPLRGWRKLRHQRN